MAWGRGRERVGWWDGPERREVLGGLGSGRSVVALVGRFCLGIVSIDYRGFDFHLRSSEFEFKCRIRVLWSPGHFVV